MTHGLRKRANRLIDALEFGATALGILRCASWRDVLSDPSPQLYAGRLRRVLRQHDTHFGLTPFRPSGRNVHHSLPDPYPIPDSCIHGYQSEDVFEHISFEAFVPILNEIHRVLVEGGRLRLSLPDYNAPIYRDRTTRREDGAFLFDPGGGGYLDESLQVRGGGHLWFPTIDLVKPAIEESLFSGSARYLQFWRHDQSYVNEPVDYRDGHIQRTAENDDRSGGRPLSIVTDLIKH